MIKEDLERRGIATVSGGSEWSIASIRGILQDEKYCGDVLRQKSFVNDCISRKHIRNVGQLPMYLTQDHHEGIWPFVVGRKNWLFCDTPKGAESSTIVYAMVETAKVNGLESFDYLSLILTSSQLCFFSKRS